MDPASRRRMAAIVVGIAGLFAFSASAEAHGGGGGGHHGGFGGRGSGRAPAFAYRYTEPRHLRFAPGWLGGYPPGYPRWDLIQAEGAGWPSFRDDLPFVRLGHFLQSHHHVAGVPGHQRPAGSAIFGHHGHSGFDGRKRPDGGGPIG